MGSARLFFALKPQKGLLGDLNSGLVQTFQIVRDDPVRLAELLHKLPHGSDAYYRLRQKDPETLSPVDAAARFIFLNRFCFNGLFRTNLSGQFNVPYASLNTGNLPTGGELLEISRILQCATIECGDFAKVLESVTKNDFVYLDPPFVVSNRRIFKQYGPESFGIGDLNRLALALNRLHDAGAFFVLSYVHCAEALTMFRDWPIEKVMVYRNMAGSVRCRGAASELLISNIPEGA